MEDARLAEANGTPRRLTVGLAVGRLAGAGCRRRVGGAQHRTLRIGPAGAADARSRGADAATPTRHSHASRDASGANGGASHAEANGARDCGAHDRRGETDGGPNARGDAEPHAEADCTTDHVWHDPDACRGCYGRGRRARPGAAAAATAAAAAAAPTSTSTSTRTSAAASAANAGVVMLTFDAGADRGYAEDILDTLAEEHVVASFGITGNWAKANPDLVRRMAADGHLVFNHTLDHRSFTGVSDSQGGLSVGGASGRAGQRRRDHRAAHRPFDRPFYRLPYGDDDAHVAADVGQTATRARSVGRWTPRAGAACSRATSWRAA